MNNNINKIKLAKNRSRYEAGITPLLILAALMASSFAIFGGSVVVNNLKDKGVINFIQSNTNTLLNGQADYLDAKKIDQSVVQGSIVGTVVLSDGSYSAYKILDGSLTDQSGGFDGEAKISFLSGDIGTGNYTDGNINPFYLKDGTWVTAVIVDRMLANFYDGHSNHAIKILNGTVIDGKLIGDFVGQTLDTGYFVSGNLGDSGKITHATVLPGAARLSEAQISITDNALSLFKNITSIFDSSSIRILGESTANTGVTGASKLNKPVYNNNTGTWVFVGGTSNGVVSTSPLQGVVSYMQNIAQSISNGNGSIQQVANLVTQGITDIKSNNSKLSVSTINNISTLSLDLSGITASGVNDGSINESDLALSNDPTNGQCLTYNSSTGGFTWGSCGTSGGSGTITGVTAGNGLSGGGTTGTVSLALNTQSGSGLSATASGISLLRTCADGELLKWTASTSSWDCSTDTGGAGGGISTLQVDDATVVSSASVIDFLGSDFDLTNSPSGEGNLSIDYTNSKIVRSDQAQSILGAWTFTNGLTLGTDAVTDITGSGLSISAGALTVSGLSTSNFTSANISQWTNNSGYITGNQSISLSGDVSGSGTTSMSTTIGSGAITLSKMANLAANSIIGNNTGSPTTPIALTASQVKTLLGISTGDVSGLGTIATQSASNVFITGGSMSGLTSVAATTFTGALTGNASSATTATSATSATSATTATTATTANALTNSDAAGQSAITAINSASTGTINAARIASLPYISTTLTSANILVGNGSNVATGVSMSGDVTIDNTGATTIGSGKISLSKMANLAANSIIGNNTSSPATPIALTAAQVKTLLGLSTSDVSGLGTIATQSASNVHITGGNLSGLASVAATTFTGALTGNASTVTGFSPTTGKVLSLSNSLTLAGTDSSILNIGSGGTLGTAAFTASTDYATTAQGTLATNALPSASFTDSAVIGKLITGFVSGAGTLSATDTILQAIQKLNGNEVLDYDSGNFVAGTNYLSPSGSAASLTNFPTLNQNTTGTASNITGVLGAGSFPAMSGDVTNTQGSLSTAIASGAVTLSKMANLAANSIIGNNTGSPATPIALTAAQVKTLLGLSTSDISGLGTIATQSASNVYITGGNVTGIVSLNGATISGGSMSGGSLSSTAVNGVTTADITLTSGSYSNPSWITSLAASKVLPDQTGNNGKVLGTNGSVLSWITNSSGVAWGAITGTLSDQTDLGTALSGKLGTTLNSANIFVGNGSNVATGVSMSGDITIDNTGATTIGSGKISLSKMANLAANSILGNNTESPATPLALTAAQVKTLLSLSTSDVSGLGTIATQSASNVHITGGNLSGLASVAATTFTGALTGNASSATTATTATTGNALANSDAAGQSAITAINSASTGTINSARIASLPYISTTLTSANILVGNGSNVATGVTMSGDISIDNTGATAIGSGKVSLSKMSNLAANSIIGNNTGDAATPVALTAAQVKTLLGLSTSDVSGLGTIATQSASNVHLTGGNISGIIALNGASISGGSLSATAVNGVTTADIVLTSGSYSNPSWITALSPTKVLPDQTGQNGKVLSTNGSALSWVTNSSGVVWGAITGTLSDQSDLNTALSGKLTTTLDSAKIFVGNGSNVATGVTVSGDITIDNTGATAIGSGKVTLVKMANLAANSIIGNNTGDPTTPLALTTAQVKTLLAIATGDVSGLGTIATQSASNVHITGGNLLGLASVTATTFTGDLTGNASSATTATTGNALANSDAAGQSAITAINSASSGTINAARIASLPYISTTLTSANILVGNGSNVATGVTMSGDVTIDNTGATVIGSGKVGLSKIADIANSTILGNNSGGAGAPIALTASQVKTVLGISTSDVSGLGTIATQASNNVSISGGSISGVTIGGTASGLTFAAGSNTLSGITASNMTAGDFSSVINSGTYTITVSSASTAGSAGTVTGFSPTSGKTLTVQKSMTLTAADDTGVYTLPTGTKTLAATDVSTLSSLTSIGTLGSLTVSGAIAANGGITFDGATDTLGAYTSAGTINMSTNILENIGNSGTDFIASTGALTLAGVLTANNGVTIATGALAVNSDSITSDGTLTIDATSSIVLGGGGNTFTISETAGPTYAGTARPTKRISLAPEYAGASLTGDASNNTGTMTSDNAGSGGAYRNYYKWTTTQGTNQDYDIFVRIPLPMDFDAMAGTPTLSIDTYTSDTTNGTVTVNVFDTAGAAAGSSCTNASFTPTGTTTWQTKTSNTCLNTGTFTAGGVMTVDIKMQSPTSGDVRVGNIQFDYLSKF